jgi:hypothetical protein
MKNFKSKVDHEISNPRGGLWQQNKPIKVNTSQVISWVMGSCMMSGE